MFEIDKVAFGAFISEQRKAKGYTQKELVEAIAANHMGMKICGISFVSNLAAGISPNPLTHEEVQEAANIAAPQFRKLVTETVKKFRQVL